MEWSQLHWVFAVAARTHSRPLLLGAHIWIIFTYFQGGEGATTCKCQAQVIEGGGESPRMMNNGYSLRIQWVTVTMRCVQAQWSQCVATPPQQLELVNKQHLSKLPTATSFLKFACEPGLRVCTRQARPPQEGLNVQWSLTAIWIGLSQNFLLPGWRDDILPDCETFPNISAGQTLWIQTPAFVVTAGTHSTAQQGHLQTGSGAAAEGEDTFLIKPTRSVFTPQVAPQTLQWEHLGPSDKRQLLNKRPVTDTYGPFVFTSQGRGERRESLDLSSCHWKNPLTVHFRAFSDEPKRCFLWLCLLSRVLFIFN